MNYAFDLIIPANTSETDPFEQEATLDAGIITHVEIDFPNGCDGLAHVRVRRGLYQVWPSNPEGDFRGNNVVIRWDEEYRLQETPYMLTLVGWNEDTAYAHTVTLRFTVIPFGEAIPSDEIPAGLTLADILGLG